MALVIVSGTTKLISGGHRGLQAMLVLLHFYVFTCFQNPKRDFFTFFCRVSYVFSNHAYPDSLPTRIQSPTQVLTAPDVHRDQCVTAKPGHHHVPCLC